MNKLYRLYPDYENCSTLKEVFINLEASFNIKYYNWKRVDLASYQPVKLELHKSDKGKKNYQFDLTVDNNLLVLSEKSLKILKPILENKGQFLEIITDSKRKKFIGFYPNNIYNNSIANLENSDWGENESGKVFFKVAFNSFPQEEYLFVVDGSALNIYATEKFKELVEKNNLTGLFFEDVLVI